MVMAEVAIPSTLRHQIKTTMALEMVIMATMAIITLRHLALDGNLLHQEWLLDLEDPHPHLLELTGRMPPHLLLMGAGEQMTVAHLVTQDPMRAIHTGVVAEEAVVTTTEAEEIRNEGVILIEVGKTRIATIHGVNDVNDMISREGNCSHYKYREAYISVAHFRFLRVHYAHPVE